MTDRHTARGRFYQDGPYSYCDQADIHPQPCTCAAPRLEDALRAEINQPPADYDGTCYWPIEDSDPVLQPPATRATPELPATHSNRHPHRVTRRPSQPKPDQHETWLDGSPTFLVGISESSV